MSDIKHKLQYLDEIYENLTALGRRDKTEGQRASVFLARHKLTEKIVVKKYVDADRVAVYEKLSQIDDAHLEKIYEYASYEKQGIILMEYISGVTLHELIQEKGKFTEEEVQHMAVELCEVLQKVHTDGIVHRDITPKNIMISNDGVLKLIDFGIAREIKEEKSQDTTILGTPGYAAPEQFGFLQTDGRTDIYALGVLLNVLLTGALPSEKTYDGSLGKIVQRCIEIDVRQRYQSVADLLEDLSERNLRQGEAHNNKEKHNTEGITDVTKETYISKWLPGFRTGVVWKGVVAVIGYFLMVMFTVTFVMDCAGSWYTALLETIACLMYLWIPFMIVTNIGYWDRKWIFAKMPHGVMITIRIMLALVFFYNGSMLEQYVKYDILGMIKN